MDITQDLDGLMDSFVNDDDGGGGGGKYLKDKEWKERGYLDFWLQQPPFKMYVHEWPTLWEVRAKKDEVQTKAPDGSTPPKLTKYFDRDYGCPEHESVHNKRRFRNDDGSPELPPATCGQCKMIEWVRHQVDSGKLDWCAPIFKFQGTHPESKIRLLHAGGVIGLFSGSAAKKLTDQQRSHMNSKGISLKTNWNESLFAVKKHKFALIDNMNIDLGVLTSTQKDGFTNSIRKILNDRKEACKAANKDMAFANPLRHPYMFRMRYDKNEIMNLIYQAIAVDLAPSPDILALINSEGPDLRKFAKPFSPSKMMGYLREHTLIDMPFDKFFEKMEEPEADGDDDSFDFGANEEKPKAVATVPDVNTKPTAPTTAPSGAKTIPCDDCQYPMLETDTKCPKCGTVYEVSPDAPAAATGSGTVTGDVVPFFQQ